MRRRGLVGKAASALSTESLHRGVSHDRCVTYKHLISLWCNALH